MQAANARLSGAQLPLFNPEMEVESERIEEDGDSVFTTKIGISQTIDWHGKGDSGARVAEREARLLTEEVKAKRHRILGDVVDVLVRYKSAQQVIALTQKKVDLLRRFLHLSEQKRRAGDIGEADASLARIALNKAVMEQAFRKSDMMELEGELQKLGGTLPILLPGLPVSLSPLEVTEADLVPLVGKHPDVRVAKLNIDLLASR